MIPCQNKVRLSFDIMIKYMKKYEEENKEDKGRNKQKQKECKELTQFDLKGLHPQWKAFDVYFFTIKLCTTMNPLKGRLNS